MNKLVIFDLDGTLFESKEMHFDCLNNALEHYGYPPISREAHLTRFNGLPTKTKLEMLGIVDREAQQVENEKQALTLKWVLENVRRNERLVRLFEQLKEAGFRIAVASNSITPTTVRALSLLGLWSYCDLVANADRSQPKPAPDMYWECMMTAKATALTTVIVEDSEIGRQGARNSGATLMAVDGPADVTFAKIIGYFAHANTDRT